VEYEPLVDIQMSTMLVGSGGNMRIVFCGETFPDTAEALRQALPVDAGDEVIVWSGEDLKTLPDNIDVLIPKMHSVDSRLLEMSRCRLVQQWGVGLEGIDILAAGDLGIPVANVPANGGNADSVAEHALLLILALLRDLTQAQLNVRNGILGAPSGSMLAGRTVCLYGLGAIALPLARRLKSFNVKLIGLTRQFSAAKMAEFGLDECYSLEEKATCLKQADVLVICARLTPETRNSINADDLASLPSGALLINVARGGLVEETALISALRSGHLGGAGLDVYWKEPIDTQHPLLQLSNVIATPHIAGITLDSLKDIAAGVAANINRLREGLPLQGVTNSRTTE
jgi:phosphoglycerate dehydrogenase-like enzyme